MEIIETINKSPNNIYLEIKETVEKKVGIHLNNPIPLNLGYLNLKWKVETGEKRYVIKQISKERYKHRDFEKVVLEQDIALHEQVRQYKNGTLCPNLLMYNGNVVHKTPSGERFIMMEHMEGNNLLPGTLNENHMYSLGVMTAKMHNISNDGTYGKEGNPKFVPPSIEKRLKHWETLYDKMKENYALMTLIEKHFKATEHFNLDIISSSEPGWAHRDLWVDNLLFNEDKLSAILDFDRFAFDYPELDIARAIMSGALKDMAFQPNVARAFLTGYRTNRELEKGTFVRSLYLLWYLESTWWVVPNLNKERYQEVQFQNEMTWIAEHLSDLTTMFKDW